MIDDMNGRAFKTGKITAFSVAAAAVLLLAPSDGWSRAGVTYGGSLGAGFLYTDNVRMASQTEEDGPERDVLAKVIPSANLAIEGDRDSIRINYRGEYRDYLEGTRKEEWRHDFEGRLDSSRLDPLRLTITDRRQMVLRYVERPEEDESNWLDSNTLTIQPSLMWPVDPNLDLQLSYIESRQTFPGEAAADDITRRTGRIRFEKRWSPLFESSLWVDWRKVQREAARDFDGFSVGAGSVHQLSPVSTLGYELNWEERSYGERDDQFWLGKVNLSRRLEREGQTRLSYSRSVEDRFDGETLVNNKAEAGLSWIFPNGLSVSVSLLYGTRDFDLEDRKDRTWGPAATARWKLASWLDFSLKGRWSQTTIEGLLETDADTGEETAAGDIEDERSIIEAALAFSIGKHIMLETGYGYLRNDSNRDARTYRSNRVWMMLNLVTGQMGRGRV